MASPTPRSTKMRPASPAAAHPGVIELELHDLKQLFNSMDPTPFPGKDLDRDAEEFIVGWTQEFHDRVPLTLVIYLAAYHGKQDPSVLVQDTVRAYFTQKAGVTRRRFRRLMGQGRTSLIIGLAFLALCLGAADLVQRLGEAPPLVILRESLIIGGWVAMWRPMEIFLYDWWPLRREWRIQERLSRATVHVALHRPELITTLASGTST
jgi:hypothetical protein